MVTLLKLAFWAFGALATYIFSTIVLGLTFAIFWEVPFSLDQAVFIHSVALVVTGTMLVAGLIESRRANRLGHKQEFEMQGYEFKDCPLCGGYGVRDNGAQCRECEGSGEIIRETGKFVTIRKAEFHERMIADAFQVPNKTLGAEQPSASWVDMASREK